MKEARNIRQRANWNRYLVQRKVELKRYERDIALIFTSHWRILFAIVSIVRHVHVLFTLLLQFVH